MAGELRSPMSDSHLTIASSVEANSVEFLLRNKFPLLSDSEKMLVKAAGPQKPNLEICPQGRRIRRHFSSTWYTKYEWLAGCPMRNKLFCFYCLCFPSSSSADAFSRSGYDDMKNLSRTLKRHAESRSHISAGVAYKRFGQLNIHTGLNESVIQHNSRVARNREVLRRLIGVVELFTRQELSFRPHERSQNRGNYIEFIDFLASYDSVLREHLTTSSAFKGTSEHVQNDLIESIAFVLNSEIRKEIHDSIFFAVEVDETIDSSGCLQLALILRYVNVNPAGKHFDVKERFLGFLQGTQRHAEELSAAIIENLKAFEMEKKLVNQTYDGATILAGETPSVQAIIKAVAPMAHFTHSAAHGLNLTLQDSCLSIRPVKRFLGTLANIQTFFHGAPKRLEYLDEIAASGKFGLPRGSATSWDFKSRCVSVVSNQYDVLREFLYSVANDTDSWDSATISSAHAFLRQVEDEDFIFLLLFFDYIFGHVDALDNVIQSKTLDIAACESSIQHFMTFLSSSCTDDVIITLLERAKELVSFTNMKNTFCHQKVALEVIDNLKEQIGTRFNDITHLNCFSLLDHTRFIQYHCKFPADILEQVEKSYPLFDLAKLRSELEVVYADPQFCVPQHTLLTDILENGLFDVLSESFKLLLLYFTIPLTRPSAERPFPTLERVKTYLTNTISNSAQLDSLSLISIEKELLEKIDREQIIDHFASLEGRRADFLFK